MLHPHMLCNPQAAGEGDKDTQGCLGSSELPSRRGGFLRHPHVGSAPKLWVQETQRRSWFGWRGKEGAQWWHFPTKAFAEWLDVLFLLVSPQHT